MTTLVRASAGLAEPLGAPSARFFPLARRPHDQELRDEAAFTYQRPHSILGIAKLRMRAS